MNIPILRCMVLAWALLLLAWPAATVWAAENTAVPATTPTADFVLDDTNGTAYHTKTGLTWKRCIEGWVWNGNTCVDDTGVADNYTWSLALQRGPALGTFAGFSDWRLPNMKELGSIVEQRNWNPAINATVFPNTPNYYFWSASPSAGSAWGVSFLNGGGDADVKGDDHAVRMVRGGQYALLSVTKAGSGSGTVASSLPGVDCGQFCKGSFANEMFTAGQVILTATPGANSTFGSWTDCPLVNGNQCTVNSAVNQTVTVTATFTANTTTTITSDNPDPSVVGEAVTVSFTVAAAVTVKAASATVQVVAPGPTGDVTVSDGAVSCTGTVVEGTCELTFTSPGSKTLTATYAGDASFNGSTSANEPHTVNKANTTTTITSDNPDPSAVGQAVTVNYTVAVTAPGAGTPTGNVTVSDGTDSCTGAVAKGTCELTFTSPGSKTLAATYAGDANFNTSASAGASHEVLATTAEGNAGGGLVKAEIKGGTCVGFVNGSTSFPDPPTPLPGVTFPYGLFEFTAVCPTGGTLTLTMTYPNSLPPGTRYWKYGPTADNHNPHWYMLPPSQATITGNTAVFTITDGGLGDDDLAANGAIVDQGGPGAPGAGGATGIPTLQEWALLLLGLMLGGLVWRQSRRTTAYRFPA